MNSSKYIFITALTFFGCNASPAELGNESTFLSFGFEGAQAIPEITNTTTAATYLKANKYVASPVAGYGLQDTLQQGDTLIDFTNKSVLVAFGYDQTEAAQLKAKVIDCKSMPDPVVANMDWSEGEKCLQPLGVGDTGQLALLSCGTLSGNASSSCVSVSVLRKLMRGTFFNEFESPATDSLALTQGTDDFVNTNFDIIGAASAKRGSATFSSASGTANYPDAVVTTYKTGQNALGLLSSGGMKVELTSVGGKGVVGYSALDGRLDGSSDSDPGPIPAGNTGDPIWLQDTGVSLTGNVKIFFTE